MEWLGRIDRRYPASHSDLRTPSPPFSVAIPLPAGRDRVWKVIIQTDHIICLPGRRGGERSSDPPDRDIRNQLLIMG